MEAIRTLQRIEGEGRLATSEEQEVLAQYVGWGGLPQAFDERNEAWSKEYAELKGLLSDEEYASARASTLNAHYTSPTVVKAIYGTLERMGLASGNILEPACGTGNFFGLVPESMAGANLYGVELDGITGRIARQLYQKANITVDGYEKTRFPDNFFDAAVGNVPFTDENGYRMGTFTLSRAPEAFRATEESLMRVLPRPRNTCGQELKHEITEGDIVALKLSENPKVHLKPYTKGSFFDGEIAHVDKERGYCVQKAGNSLTVHRL